MALTTLEKQVAKELKSQGYSIGEIRGFIASNRVERPSRVSNDLLSTEPPQNRFSDVGEDIATTAKETFSSLKQRASDVKAEVTDPRNLTNPTRVAGIIGGNIAGAGADVVEAPFMAAGRAALTQKEEEAVGGAVKAGMERTGIPQRIARMEPRNQRATRALLGAVEGVGVGAGGVATKGVSRSISRGVSKLDDAASTLTRSGVRETGERGIKQSFDIGINPEDLMQRVARISKGKQAKFEDLANESVGSYLVSRNIFGTPDDIVRQLWDRMQTYKQRVDRNLAKVDGTYKDRAVKEALEELSARDAKVSPAGAVDPDSGRIKDLLKKHQNEGLTLSEVNEVKRLYERNVKVDYLRDNVSDKIARAKNIDSSLRKFVEDKASAGGFKNVKQLNKETQLARQLADDLGDEFAGSAGNNAISLTDWLLIAEIGGTGSPAAITTALGKRFFGSQRVMNATAKALARNRGVKANVPAQRTDPQVSGYLQFLQRQNASD